MYKLKIAKAFFNDLTKAYDACIEAGYTLDEDRSLIKSMMWTNLLSYPITDTLLDVFLDGYLEPFKDR